MLDVLENGNRIEASMRHQEPDNCYYCGKETKYGRRLVFTRLPVPTCSTCWGIVTKTLELIGIEVRRIK